MNGKRLLILTHRYLGIPLSLVFIVWFISGMVMMYTGGMPSLSEARRLAHATSLDLQAIAVSPAQAAVVSGRQSMPVLRMLMGRPVYQYAGASLQGVYADTGERLDGSDFSSRQAAARFLGLDGSQLRRAGRLEETDQWTLGLQRLLPLEKFTAADGLGSEIYVSPSRGQVALHTTRTDRLLAWAGAIPHWFYLEGLRENQRLWARSVIWTSTLACLFALLGLTLLVTQFRRTRPFSLRHAIPYHGAYRWHYLLGGLFGLLTLTWAFSGLLSMEPYRWTREQGYSLPPDLLAGGTPAPEHYGAITAANNMPLMEHGGPHQLKEVRFILLLGEPYFELLLSDTSAAGSPVVTSRYVHAGTLATRNTILPRERILSFLNDRLAGVEVTNSAVLADYDNYYFARHAYRDDNPPLPVLRVELNDPSQSWYYVDMNSGRFVYRNHRTGRLQRWLFNGLHSLDFRIWYESRPLWDIGMLLLLLGGTLLSLIGAWLGFGRLGRWLRRLAG